MCAYWVRGLAPVPCQSRNVYRSLAVAGEKTYRVRLRFIPSTLVFHTPTVSNHRVTDRFQSLLDRTDVQNQSKAESIIPASNKCVINASYHPNVWAECILRLRAADDIHFAGSTQQNLDLDSEYFNIWAVFGAEKDKDQWHTQFIL